MQGNENYQQAQAAKRIALQRTRAALEAAGGALATAELAAREYAFGLADVIEARQALRRAFNVVRLHLGEEVVTDDSTTPTE